MKKLLALLLTGMMTLSMVACGSSKEEAGNRLESILAAGKIVICTSPDYAPYEFEDPTKEGQDKYVGADMELARYIAEKLGVELEITAMDFDACIAAVGEARVDLGIIGMDATEDRALIMEFTDEYYNDTSQKMVIRKEDAEKYTSIASFDETTTVAAQNGTLQVGLVTGQTTATLEPIAKITDGVLMLEGGKIDGLAAAEVVANSIVEKNDALTLVPENFEYSSDGIVCGVPKGEEELVAKLNEIIAEVVASGIYYEWMDEANALANSLGVTN